MSSKNLKKAMESYSLDEICSYSKTRISIDEITNRNYISTENMVVNKGGITEASTLPNTKNVVKYDKGNTLISNIRPYFKKIWYANKEGGASNDVLVFKGDSQKVLDKYLYYFLSQDKFFDYIMRTSKGTKMPRGDKDAILKYNITLPPLEEQKAIAKVLSDLDEKIETNNKINKTLEEMAQAIFKQWFVDFEFPNEEGKPYKSSGGEMVESELGVIPKGWKLNEIYKIADVIYGAAFSSKKFNEDKIGLPLIRIRDLKTTAPTFYTDEEHKKATKVNAGDILVGMDAEFTPTIWRGEQGYLNQRVCMFKPNKSYIHNYFIYESIKPYMKLMEFAKVGTTVIHLGKSDIDNMKLIIPDNEILSEFNHLIEPLYDKLIEVSKENRGLINLRDTLLPKLMSGEIRVQLNN